MWAPPGQDMHVEFWSIQQSALHSLSLLLTITLSIRCQCLLCCSWTDGKLCWLWKGREINRSSKVTVCRCCILKRHSSQWFFSKSCPRRILYYWRRLREQWVCFLLVGLQRCLVSRRRFFYWLHLPVNLYLLHRHSPIATGLKRLGEGYGLACSRIGWRRGNVSQCRQPHSLVLSYLGQAERYGQGGWR